MKYNQDLRKIRRKPASALGLGVGSSENSSAYLQEYAINIAAELVFKRVWWSKISIFVGFLGSAFAHSSELFVFKMPSPYN